MWTRLYWAWLHQTLVSWMGWWWFSSWYCRCPITWDYMSKEKHVSREFIVHSSLDNADYMISVHLGKTNLNRDISFFVTCIQCHRFMDDTEKPNSSSRRFCDTGNSLDENVRITLPITFRPKTVGLCCRRSMHWRRQWVCVAEFALRNLWELINTDNLMRPIN